MSFANCGLPHVVGGEIAEEHTLLIQTPDSLRDRFNLDIRVVTEAVCIDRQAQHIELHELTSDTCYWEAYDALVLSTGAAPSSPRFLASHILAISRYVLGSTWNR